MNKSRIKWWSDFGYITINPTGGGAPKEKRFHWSLIIAVFWGGGKERKGILQIYQLDSQILCEVKNYSVFVYLCLYIYICKRVLVVISWLILQLLKTLFGNNLASQYEGVLSGPSRSQGKALRLGSSSLRPGLYHYCFMAPYTHFTQALADASLRNMVQAEQDQDTSGWDLVTHVSHTYA